MTDKERLEEIKERFVKYQTDYNLNGEDVEWLINRVEELEDKCNYLSDMNEMLVDLNGVLPDEPELYIKLKKENKRYREAIEVAIQNMVACKNLGVKFALKILEQALEVEQ